MYKKLKCECKCECKFGENRYNKILDAFIKNKVNIVRFSGIFLIQCEYEDEIYIARSLNLDNGECWEIKNEDKKEIKIVISKIFNKITVGDE